MAGSIRLLNIIFTTELTLVCDDLTSISEPHLRIQIVPTADDKNISEIKVSYYNPSFSPPRLNEKLDDHSVFQALVFSMKGDEATLFDKANIYMNNLSNDEISMIIKEYGKYIQDGTVLDGFISGLAAYLSFLLLMENGIFANQLPFQFTSPVLVNSGNAVNRNMFQYLSLPLTALSKISNGILLQLVLFIQTFINLWEPMFTDGPIIGSGIETRMHMEIVTGLSQNIIDLMYRTRLHAETLTNNVEQRLVAFNQTLLHDLCELKNHIMDETDINALSKRINELFDQYGLSKIREEFSGLSEKFEVTNNNVNNLHMKILETNDELLIEKEKICNLQNQIDTCLAANYVKYDDLCDFNGFAKTCDITMLTNRIDNLNAKLDMLLLQKDIHHAIKQDGMQVNVVNTAGYNSNFNMLNTIPNKFTRSQQTGNNKKVELYRNNSTVTNFTGIDSSNNDSTGISDNSSSRPWNSKRK